MTGTRARGCPHHFSFAHNSPCSLRLREWHRPGASDVTPGRQQRRTSGARSYEGLKKRNVPVALKALRSVYVCLQHRMHPSVDIFCYFEPNSGVPSSVVNLLTNGSNPSKYHPQDPKIRYKRLSSLATFSPNITYLDTHDKTK